MPTALLERPHIGEAHVVDGAEVTNAELARRLEAFRQDIHGDLAEIMRRQESYVLREVYAADQRRHEDLIQGLKVQMAAEKVERGREFERLRGQVKWLWSAVVMPLVALMISFLMQAGGG